MGNRVKTTAPIIGAKDRVRQMERTLYAPIGAKDRVSGQILVARGKETVGLAAPGEKGATPPGNGTIHFHTAP